MPDDRRQFVLRKNGEETSVFTGEFPRQAALKAARRLDAEDSEGEAVADSKRIRLREHGTINVHVYDAWAWQETAPADGPEWLGNTVTRANVSKVDIEVITKPESELDYSRLEPLIVDKPIEVREELCETCGSVLEESGSVTVVEDIPSPTEPIQYKRYNYKCDNCGTKNRGTNTNCPSNGAFGTNVLAQAVLLYYEYRLPYGKVSQLFEDIHKYEISPASVVHSCDYLYPAARSEYERIHKNIQESDVLYIDETQYPVDGDKNWLWGFTNGIETLYSLRESRGSVVLEEILGNYFKGIIVCDGWTGYSAYHSRLQRCWAHLLREKDDISDDDKEAKSLYESLQDVHNGLKEFLDTNPSLVQRIVVQQEARRMLETLIAEGAESEKALDALQTLQGGLGDWLTFVVHPNVDSTNNQGERILRESVIRRKTMGTLREEKGVTSYETYQSLIRTWKQQDRNPYTELKSLAKQVGDTHTVAQDAWN